jgi:hypothetical protein
MSLIQIESHTAPETLDVREIAPRERHPLIFGTFDRLRPGESFILLNDHDPKPLYYQFNLEGIDAACLFVRRPSKRFQRCGNFTAASCHSQVS